MAQHGNLWWVTCGMIALVLAVLWGASGVQWLLEQRPRTRMSPSNEVSAADSRADARRSCLRWAKLSAAVMLTFVCTMTAVGFGCRWLALRWVLALVPPLLVVLHLFQLLLQRSRKIENVVVDVPYPGGVEAAKDVAWVKQLREQFERVAEQLRFAIGENYSNPGILLVRLVAPACLLLLACSGLLVVIGQPDGTWLHSSLNFDEPHKTVTRCLLSGLNYGAAGAYVWVLFELIERCFRRDLTPGSVLWCAVTLVLGPLLGALVAIILKLEAIGAKGEPVWQPGVVLFFAGFAPRRIVDIVSSVAQQMLRSQASQSTARAIPLTSLRGIALPVIERLTQEGIYDVHSLAFADPVRLLRNTAYDLRQIVSWMDQALLMVFCPKLVPALEEAGIIGAIDLAWYEVLALCAEAATPAPPSPFAVLQKTVQVDADILRDAARRLYYDEQVRLVWVLYNTFSMQPSDSDGKSKTTNGGS